MLVGEETPRMIAASSKHEASQDSTRSRSVPARNQLFLAPPARVAPVHCLQLLRGRCLLACNEQQALDTWSQWVEQAPLIHCHWNFISLASTN